MKIIFLLFAALASTAVADITDVTAQPELMAFLQKAEEVTLYSLDPTPPDEQPVDKKKNKKPVEKLHGYIVLGKIASAPKDLRERLRTVFLTAIMSPDEPYACFEPRMAVSFVGEGKRVDILMSYHCHGSKFYYGDEWEEGPLGTYGEEELNALLDARGIKRDIPKPHAPPIPKNE